MNRAKSVRFRPGRKTRRNPRKRVRQALYSGGHRKLKRMLPRVSKAEHIKRAEALAEKAARLRQQWGDTQEREHMRVFGKAPTIGDYRISGIGRDEYSKRAKDKLRGLAHAATEFSDASQAHWRAAGKSLATWRRMRDEMNRRDFNPYTERGLPDPRKPISRAEAEFFMTPNPRRARVKKNPSGKHNPYAWLKDARTGETIARVNYPAPERELLAAVQSLADKRGSPVRIERLAKRNPTESAAVTRAARRFARFTGHRAEEIERVPFPPKPKAGLAVGPVLMLGYSATRDGQRNNYVHEFRPHARPMLIASDDGRALYLVGGRYKFTERGIVDKRK